MSGLGEINITVAEMTVIGIVIEGFLYGTNIFELLWIIASESLSHFACPGLYSGMFCLYIQHQASKGLDVNKTNIVLYALSILYILSGATAVLDITRFVVTEVSKTCIHNRNKFSVYTSLSQVFTSGTSPLLFRLLYASSIIDALCDFISQAVLVCTKPLSISISCCTHLHFPRSTDVGSYGVRTSVS